MTYQDLSLEQLKADCQQQIDQYHRQSKNDDGSLSCLEIVRRAAQNISGAFTVLWEITTPLIERIIFRKYSRQFVDYEDDIVQDASIRLFQRFYHSTKPFGISTFPAYRNYINCIIQSVVSDIIEYEKIRTSLEELQEKRGLEPETPDIASEVIQNDLAKLVLAMLPDPLEREVFRRKHRLGETAEQIVAALLPLYPDITTQRVFRLLELAMRRLRKNPNIQNLR